MDEISLLETTSIPSILMPTIKAFIPTLLKNKEEILSIEFTTHSYGVHPRQQLDVYEPKTPSSTSAILIFFYGGGLQRGDKILQAVPDGLVYHNLGSFFAKRGFTTIIADYRRVNNTHTGTGENAVYPSGGEDMEAIISWLGDSYLSSQSCSSEARNLFLLGNSAGGVHMSTFLLDHRFERSRKAAYTGSNHLRLSGAVLVSVPLDFAEASAERSDILNKYWPSYLTTEGATRGSIESFCPCGLLASYKKTYGDHQTKPSDFGIPPILFLLGSRDPEDEIIRPAKRFISLWTQAFQGKDDEEFETNGDDEGRRLELKWMPGHNHISPPYALMSGDPKGEEWAEEVVLWMQNLCQNESRALGHNSD